MVRLPTFGVVEKETERNTSRLIDWSLRTAESPKMSISTSLLNLIPSHFHLLAIVLVSDENSTAEQSRSFCCEWTDFRFALINDVRKSFSKNFSWSSGVWEKLIISCGDPQWRNNNYNAYRERKLVIGDVS